MRDHTPTPSLVIHVGPFAYDVRVAPRPIVWEGRRRRGIAENAARRITIGPDVPADQRLQVLLHEVRHCWSWAFAHDAGTEDAANRFSTMAYVAFMDLHAAGGLDALVAMRPTGRPWKEAKRA